MSYNCLVHSDLQLGGREKVVKIFRPANINKLCTNISINLFQNLAKISDKNPK